MLITAFTVGRYVSLYSRYKVSQWPPTFLLGNESFGILQSPPRSSKLLIVSSFWPKFWSNFYSLERSLHTSPAKILLNATTLITSAEEYTIRTPINIQRYSKTTEHKHKIHYSVSKQTCGNAVALLVEAPHCATSQEVAGSIPNGVTEIFYWHNISCRRMFLGSTQRLMEMWPVLTADNLTAFRFRFYWNLVASSSWNPLFLNKPE